MHETIDRRRLRPRNPWSRILSALELMEGGQPTTASKLLASIAYHPEISESTKAALQASFLRQDLVGIEQIDTPSDYWRSRNPSILKPFNKLLRDRSLPKPYPWLMCLPPHVGIRNNWKFLHEASLGISKRDPITRVLFVLIDETKDRVALNETIAQLTRLDFAGKLVALAYTSETNLARPASLEIHCCAEPFNSAAGQETMTTLAADADLLILMTGRHELDPGFLARICPIAEVSTRVAFPLLPLPSEMAATEMYNVSTAIGLLNGRYPFRQVAGLNIAMRPRLWAEVGGINPDFKQTFFSGCELAYRLQAAGCWLVAALLRSMDSFDVGRGDKDDAKLFAHLAPSQWDRMSGASYKTPRVSIYIPAYNASAYICDAIESVLQQDYMDLNVCVVNDGSPDDTLKVLRDNYGSHERVVIQDCPNGGIGFASNCAVAMSRSEYVGQLDSDDRLKPGAVSSLVAVLDEDPNLVCAYSSCERIDGRGNFLQLEYSWPTFSREKMMQTSIVHHFRMFRRQAWSRTGGFREDIRNAVDYDMFLKLSELGPLKHVEELLYQRRWHGANTSAVNEGTQTANTYVVQTESLARQGMGDAWRVTVPKPSAPRSVLYVRSAERPLVLFWPDYSNSNPYQKLLYAELRHKSDVMSGTVDDALRAVEDRSLAAGSVVFHLHWLNAIFRDVTDLADADARAKRFLERVKKFIWKGGRFVWTIHNTISHDSPYPEVEQRLSVGLAEAAHALHFHSAASIDEVASAFSFDRSKVRLYPHGNYIGAYPDTVSKQQARELLGLSPADDVILFFGQGRRYKGIELLAEAFTELAAKRVALRLVVAGTMDPQVMAAIEATTENLRRRVQVVNERIDDGALQVYLRAADFCVFPYARILTSGSVLLSLSFGRPAIVPRVGMTDELLRDRHAGIAYDPAGGKAALKRAIRQLLLAKANGELGAMEKNARDLAAEQRWPDFGPTLGL